MQINLLPPRSLRIPFLRGGRRRCYCPCLGLAGGRTLSAAADLAGSSVRAVAAASRIADVVAETSERAARQRAAEVVAAAAVTGRQLTGCNQPEQAETVGKTTTAPADLAGPGTGIVAALAVPEGNSVWTVGCCWGVAGVVSAAAALVLAAGLGLGLDCYCSTADFDSGSGSVGDCMQPGFDDLERAPHCWRCLTQAVCTAPQQAEDSHGWDG